MRSTLIPSATGPATRQAPAMSPRMLHLPDPEEEQRQQDERCRLGEDGDPEEEATEQPVILTGGPVEAGHRPDEEQREQLPDDHVEVAVNGGQDDGYWVEDEPDQDHQESPPRRPVT